MDAVRALLGDVPSVEVESVEYERNIGRAYGVDGLIGLTYPGGSYAIVVEVRSNGAPRFVRSGVYQLESCVARLRQSGEANGGRRLIPMLVSSYLSPESRAICTDHDIAYLDLAGNARLAFDTVYIERTVADKPRSERRIESRPNPLTSASMLSPSTIRLTRPGSSSRGNCFPRGRDALDRGPFLWGYLFRREWRLGTARSNARTSTIPTIHGRSSAVGFVMKSTSRLAGSSGLHCRCEL